MLRNLVTRKLPREERNYLKALLKIKQNKKLGKIEYEICKRNIQYFFESYVFTLDPHDRRMPVKRFPSKKDKPYLYKLIETWEREPLLLVPKSRQIMATWTIVGCYLHDTLFHEGRLNFFQSKKEADANDLVQRAKFIYDHLPKWLKRYPVNPNAIPRGSELYLKFEVPFINSKIVGVPQGPDVLRMHTASGIFADEMAFQDQSEAAFQACKPTIDGGGRFTGVSSAHPGFFQLLVEDSVGMK